MTLDDIPIPDTAAARQVLDVAATFHTPALLNHCLRSYLFAASYGTSQLIGYDVELLYISSLLHDIGLTREFDNHTIDFEDAGGLVAWVFAAGAGWPAERRDRARLAIVDHMKPSVDPDIDPEGHLLEVSTSLDISGANPDLWPDILRAQVVAAYPRLDLAEDFTRCMTAQAERKPDSGAGRIVRNGLASKLAANPL
jgi:hypothetical protein